MKYSLIYKSEIEDPCLRLLFEMLAMKGRDKDTFYDGHVVSSESFVQMVRREDLHFWLCMADETPLGMVWMTDLKNGVANMHYATFGLLHPVCQLRGAKFALREILNMRDEQGYILGCIFANTPVRNKKAIRFNELLGFQFMRHKENEVWMADKRQLETAWQGFVFRETACK